MHCTNEKFKNQFDYLQGVGSIRMILKTSREFQITVKIKEPMMISEHSDIWKLTLIKRNLQEV